MEQELDTQGDTWPPREALVARLKDYGPPFDGSLVEVGEYWVDGQYFRCQLVDWPPVGDDTPPGEDDMLVLKSELEPLNAATEDYIAGVTVGDLGLYHSFIYEIRDHLAEFEIYCTAASIGQWTTEQIDRVQKWLSLLPKNVNHTALKEKLK